MMSCTTHFLKTNIKIVRLCSSDNKIIRAIKLNNFKSVNFYSKKCEFSTLKVLILNLKSVNSYKRTLADPGGGGGGGVQGVRTPLEK